MKKANVWSLGVLLFLISALFPMTLLGQSNPRTLQLSGNWTAYIPAKNWSHSGYQIIQNGQDLTYVVWSGERHNGRVLSENTISYVQANGTGTVSSDGNRIDWSTGGYWIKEVIQPPPHGVRYHVENFVYGPPYEFVNPRNIHHFIVDWATCSVWQVNTPEQAKTAIVHVSLCRDRQRLQFTVEFDGQLVQYAWVFLDDGKTISGAYNEGGTFGPSVGGIDN